MLGDVLGELLPLGLAIGLSPFPIIAIVLLLLSERARVNGPLFLFGWVVGTLVLVTVFTLLSSALDSTTRSEQSRYEGAGQIVIGSVLLVLAIRKGKKFLAGSATELPGWMASITTATPARSLGLGLMLSTVNPKNFLVAVAAGLALGSADLNTRDAVIALASYTLVASVTVIVPVLGHAIWPSTTAPALTLLEKWLTANSTALMALLLAIFGVVILGNGISAL
jgi:hypothetical protein